MPDIAKHLAILGLAVPVGLGGYHLAAGAVGEETGRLALVDAADLSLRRTGSGEHALARLAILERDLNYLESRYVERDRLDAEAMFQGALDRVERKVPEVMFQREPQGARLHVSVGSHSTVLSLSPIEDLGDMQAALREVARVLDANLATDVDRQAVEYDLVNGALGALDPHTLLMPPAAADEMGVDNKGEFGGLGIEITVEEGVLTIKQPIDDTPADEAGLKANDRIVRIEDESTINMDLSDAVSKLRGKPGDPVTIHVQRKGLSKPRPYTIVRDIIKVNPVEGELLEGGVGYVRIRAFNAPTSDGLQTLLDRFARESGGELRGLVLDLRGNPGGYYDQAVEVSNAFLDDGVVVSTYEPSTGRRQERRASRPQTQPAYPIAVLVDGNSASASEIVAGALRNHDRAVIIGERTFGKGSVQNLYEHPDGSMLKMTTQKYLTPGDQSIQGVGILPDVELRPALVEPAEREVDGVMVPDPDGLPAISLYWREWIDREADYDNILNAEAAAQLRPGWTARYLRDVDADRDDPRADWEVELGRQVVLSAMGPRRPDVLASAGVLLEQAIADADAEITTAMAQVGLDWSVGDNPETATVDAWLDLGPDDALVAGETERVTLHVRNDGVVPLHRVSAVSLSDNPFLDHREFYLGRIAPGETATAQVDVTLAEGYPTERAEVSLTLRTPDDTELALAQAAVETLGRDLPRFAYDLALVDDGSGESRGDGDGIPEPGEVVELEVAVTNVGDGPTEEAFVRLRNRSGRILDLRSGSFDVGLLIDDTGAACEEVGEDCRYVLAAGETHRGRLAFEVREAPEEGPWKLELTVGDNRAYDFASVQRGGFYEFFQLKEALELLPGQPIDGDTRRPPDIRITRGGDGQASGQSLVVSGVVEDDRGVHDVMVFHGEDKVFYRGGDDEARSVPLSVERTLQPGENLLVVLARDDQGLTSTRAITAMGPDEPPASAAPPSTAAR